MLLQYPFMQQAVLASLLIGVGLSLVGVLVVLLDIPFLGITMSHAAFLGAVAGAVFGFSPVWGAAAACAVAAACAAPLAARARASTNVALSIVFSGMIGAAFVLMHFLPGPRSAALGLIWGSLLTVSMQELLLLAGLAAGVTGLVAVFYRWLLALLYDRAVARTCGVPAAWLYGGVILLTGLVISASLQAVGGVLIFGLLVNPPSAARRMTCRLDRLFLLSALFGVLSCWSGLWLSVLWDIPAGPVIVLVSCAIFALCCGLSRLQRRRG